MTIPSDRLLIASSSRALKSAGSGQWLTGRDRSYGVPRRHSRRSFFSGNRHYRPKPVNRILDQPPVVAGSYECTQQSVNFGPGGPVKYGAAVRVVLLVVPPHQGGPLV